ncbi:GNAT family N-acetyltransferase [Marinilactibacillus sp. 15R]|uniref:GNAT family N-acetyltransferase n=1 Tax=Marinilactibacillus sp. 15R TaxID=1911586 RepID=UPI000909DBBF|nr:GNAT family N-acetyltransferase [Marinilactibacillus sp. 15R]API88649.1 GNAT family N-acetyltransferase [Marinilactibacillus sp. 15R]
MEFTKGNNRFYKEEHGKVIAEITYVPQENQVAIDHTFVDPSLRGQGVAEQLVDRVVEEMKKENKKIVASCPYVVELFKRKSEKYQSINANA